ncbi:MAG: hypothetical protein HY903_11295 [Deltaproteobacteria bacterium]|nr:hypothetical protein [Deltaproteobacteria bacterium]
MQPLAVRVGVLALFAAVSSGLCGCSGNVPTCSAGQMKTDGVLAEELRVMARGCATACWSFAFDDVCGPGCVPIDFTAPSGVLVADRRLMLVMVDDADNRAGTVYRFGFEDEAGGQAPDGWGFMANGPASYIADTVTSTARFVIEAGQTHQDRVNGEQSFSKAHRSEPGRLEILIAETDRLAGRMFLGFNSPTAQPGSEILGCFDLSVKDGVDPLYKVLATN